MLKFLKSQSLADYNTFGFDAKADLFVELNSINEFQSLLISSEWKENKHLILGGGSNILLTDDFHGLVISNRISGIEIIDENESSIVVKCGGGENWHQFVLYSLKNNWGGLENLSLIPGTVGAAPMQNIGAYGVEIKDRFQSLEAVNIETGEVEYFKAEECRFGYRESIFKHDLKGQYLISSVSFQLDKPGYHQLNLDYGIIKNILSERNIVKPSIQDVSNAVIEIRQSKLPDPAEIGNSGSFFKNPIVHAVQFDRLKSEFPEIPSYELQDGRIKLAAGWLIEKAGWKGHQENGVGVHHKQALVLVNYGQGKGKDILTLAKKIQDSIRLKFGIELSPEVNFI
ncbi:UDP-N-acetylenolpyruvoylglucosamine reductase [Marivirga tractuosa]|uniref:UDP-N-acetylenolpyruvoylglucosamine reductase n=1 Tax=Marivirga tractuosa (strain ATCC 23168 / DSM 4126 / NBRC 15989 / NCIMB 1408 / VKM B-1430 / H-43) TaxID=643867 RepID=E4TTL1_MARTH|nr:UDP-N-acetylmuramate dehydrogenase [Marivirga tractuosa]ADR20928.1 UDP-N-acetylenolpyruvoylglucosamine reductase [Marivirga tractuosa DSM 4126]BDD14621.1 UDP-N-acetylenolpyruvoylglucosamine reductase [Marivirga tractuosa]